MLSAESANGEYPVLSAATQAKIASRIENYINYQKIVTDSFLANINDSHKDTNNAIASTISQTAVLLDAKLIVCFSQSPEAIKLISKSRPCCPILFMTNNRAEAFASCLNWGVYPTLLPYIPQFIEEMEVLTILKARTLDLKPGSKIILTGGIPTDSPNANFIKVITLNNKKGYDIND